LHYAFVKIQDWKNSIQIDPIETVSSLCGCKGLEIDVQDKWLKTPLNYASQRGASICAMYLAQRGAQLESKDIYGNTPLGVGLMHSHYNYGIILIQKGASVHPITFREDPERIKKQWEEEEKHKKALYRQQKRASKGGKQQEDEEMKNADSESDEDEGEKFAKHKQKKHQNLFQANPMGVEYGNEYDDEDEESDADSDDQHQENVFNQQNAFGMQVFAQPAQRSTFNFGGNFNPWGAPAATAKQPATTT
jgi:hypothetical protein